MLCLSAFAHFAKSKLHLLVGAAGIEPAASRLQTENSDRTELHPVINLAHVIGFEPRLTSPKSAVLPREFVQAQFHGPRDHNLSLEI